MAFLSNDSLGYKLKKKINSCRLHNIQQCPPLNGPSRHPAWVGWCCVLLLLLSSYIYFMLVLTTMFFPHSGFYDGSIKQAGLSSELLISII